MGLLDIVRSGVAIANKLTADVQATITHEAFISQTGKGAPMFAAPVQRPAIVSMKSQSVFNIFGELSYSKASIVILDPTVVTSDDDRFTLPDGTTGRVLMRNGFIDRVTGRPILTQVFLG